MLYFICSENPLIADSQSFESEPYTAVSSLICNEIFPEKLTNLCLNFSLFLLT